MAASDPRSAPTLNEHAIASLEFIRSTIERSASFTAVPGLGGVAMGAIGLATAGMAMSQPDGWRWLTVWLAAAAIATPVGLLAMRAKARRHNIPLWTANGQRFAQGFAPPLAAAAALTFALARSGRFDLMPATWLLLYGAGVLAGATASIRLLTWVGSTFMLLGAGAAAAGGAGRDLWLAAGFGGVHIVFGLMIARKHGG